MTYLRVSFKSVHSNSTEERLKKKKKSYYLISLYEIFLKSQNFIVIKINFFRFLT